MTCLVQNCTIDNCKCNRILQSDKPILSVFSDDEITREFYKRALEKLGDPRIGVTGYPQLGYLG